MKTIRLAFPSPKYGTFYTVIDAGYLPLISFYKFRLLKGKGLNTDYVRCRFMGRGETILLHRLIMNATPNQMIDHINGDGMDNRIENLRVCDYSLNNSNARIRKDNTTGCRGVHVINGKYIARLQYKGIRYSLGTFNSIEDARFAYTEKYKEIHGRLPR